MSEYYPDYQPNKPIVEESKRVHGRFNLVPDRADACDQVQIDHRGEQHRKLHLFEITEKHRSISERLSAAGLSRLEEHVVSDTESYFDVPLQAKPLLNEQLFPGRESTDTYVSDRELFHLLGKTWKQIYKTTQHIPSEILASTGMIEFVQNSETLFAIPPYSDWEQVQDEKVAQKMFDESVNRELLTVYPYTPIQDLCEAAHQGFKE